MPRQLEPLPGETGFYGKLPSQGDFVTRRLPGTFVQLWDEWLQRCSAHSREVLGADWARLFRDAPVWWFLLAPGTCGDSSWAGLVQPSVDRVGRLFPLTVAAELPGDVEVLETLNAAHAWYEAIERAAAAAFDPEVRLEVIDARLQTLGFPAGALARVDAAEDTLPIAERVVTALKLAAGPGGDFGPVRAALREQQVNVGHSHCVWFNANPGAMECVMLVTRSLPEPQLSCAFLDGRWDVHGWESARGDIRVSG